MNLNLDLATLTAGCEAEKLHLSGAIQNHGALLILDLNGLRISHASRNFETFTGLAAESILDSSPEETLPWLAEVLASWLKSEKTDVHRLVPRIFSNGAGWLDCWLIRTHEQIIVELLPSRQATPLPEHRLQLPLFDTPRDSDQMAAYNEALIASIQEATGLARVMLYRFHEDFSGEVIAERAAPGLGSYLGLRFPASDIPAIARQLYLINPWRAIPDIHAAISPIIGEDTPDLTHSLLRSVSPVHLKYLENMGVEASFSLPIKIGAQLWGLVTCHHPSPLVLDPQSCQLCASLAKSYAMGLGIFLAQQRMQLIDSLGRRIENILQNLKNQDNPLEGLISQADRLLALMDADGLAIASGDEYVACGQAPAAEALSRLDQWFRQQSELVIMVDDPAEQHPALTAILTPLAGLAAIKVENIRQSALAGQNLRLYWFRVEELRQVTWAGNPDKPRAENTRVPTLAPRHSFERWVEVKSNTSRPWNNQDRLHCAHFRNVLLRGIL
jgi:chemotaxis family two-component system sensor kinase Cph1